MVLQLLTLIGALGMFLYGMNMMSSGLQKTAGERLRHILAAMTSNRFKSVATGLTITSVIQSSSATTVMVVGFVNAGLLALDQAIGVIMGANIGTTVTAWLISLLGFKMDISILAVPLMAVGFVMSVSKKERYKNISEFVIGFSLLFLGLSLMKNSVPDLQQTPEVLSFIGKWTGYGFWSVLIFLAFGTVLTLVLQSSSATMALTLIMLSLGWLPFEMAAAMVLGENIGTTITANIAAAMANVNAKRAAFAHTLFNLFGVIWALVLFKPFVSFIGLTITWLGYPNPAEMVGGGALDPASDEATAALYGLSMLHTLFNTINTCILIWFIPLIVKIVEHVIKSKANPEDEVFRLKFISAGPMPTAELSVVQAWKEVAHFAQISHNGFGYAKSAIRASNTDDFEKFRLKLVKYEEISDRIEYEIATFLNNIPQGSVSGHTREGLTAIYRIIDELESLGDSGEAISRLLARRNEHGQRFSDNELAAVDDMIALVDNAYGVMVANLQRSEDEKVDLQSAVACEVQINERRDELREEGICRIESGEPYQELVYFMDLIAELERMGDFIINVSQVAARARG